MPKIDIPVCPDNEPIMPIRVHLEGGAPAYVVFVGPEGSPDKYIPPDNAQAENIRAAVRSGGATDICQKGGRLFAVLPSEDAISQENYGQKIPISKTEARRYEERTKPDFPIDPAQTDKKLDAFLDLTMGYLLGKTELEEYLDQSADVPPNYITIVPKYLTDELELEAIRSEGDDEARSDSIEQVNLLIKKLESKLRNNDPTSWRQLAVEYMKAELHSGGLKAARWAVRLDPKDPDNWRVLASLLLAYYQGDKEHRGHVLDEAERTFSKVVKLDYRDSGAMFNLAKVQLAKGDLKSAATSLEQAIEINLGLGTEDGPSNGIILSKLSLTYYRLRHFERALEVADSANALLEGNDIGVLMIMGLSLMAIDKPPEPEDPLPAEMNPSSIQTDLWISMGKALYLSGRREEGRNTFKIYLDLDSAKSIEAKVKLVKAMNELYAEQDEDEKDPKLLSGTFSVLNSIVEKRPNIKSPKLWRLRGNLALKLGDIKVAISSFEMAALSDPADNNYWRMLAHLLEKVGRKKDELKALKRMMANGVDDDNLRAQIQERIEELEEFLNRQDPDEPEGGGTPPAAPEGPGTTPSRPGPGSDQLMRSPTSLGSFDIPEEESTQPQSTTWYQSLRSAAALYRRRNSRRRNSPRNIKPFDVIRNLVFGASGLQVLNGMPLPVIPAGLPVH